MKERLFGKTNVMVSELGLGTCYMAGQGQELVNTCVAQAIDHGINYFDTAADYGKGNDEKMLGIALKGRRQDIFLATKVGCVDEEGGHRKVSSLMHQFESGLSRLQVDCVDLIQLHEADQRKWWSDDTISIGEAANHCGPLIQDDEDYDFSDAACIEFLRNAKQQGKTRFLGITGKDARRLTRIVKAIEIDAMMVAHQYNPIFRNAQKYLLPLTHAKNIGVAGGAMFMKGWLAVAKNEWRYNKPDWMDDTFHHAYFRYIDLQEESGIPLPELTLRWLLSEKQIHCNVIGFQCWNDIQSNIDAITKGPLPGDLQCEIDKIGIIHPLIYQGRGRL